MLGLKTLKFVARILFLFISFSIYAQNLSNISERPFKSKQEDAERLSEKLDEVQFQMDIQRSADIPEGDVALYFEYIQEDRNLDNTLFFRYALAGSLNESTFPKYYNFLKLKYVNKYKEFNLIKEKFRKEKEGLKNRRIAANDGCTNTGFEDGTITGWMPNVTSRLAPFTSINSAAQHCITTPSMKDPLIPGLSVVSPGSNYSLRLGNTAAGGQIASIRQTFRVNTENMIFTYRYAVVLENPPGSAAGHGQEKSPHFKANLYDENNKLIECFGYLVIVDNNLSDYKRICLSPPNNQNLNWDDNTTIIQNKGCNDNYAVGPAGICDPQKMEIYYKDWTKVSIPLNNYIGKNITIEFVAADCAPKGHLGYAYIDAECKPYEIVAEGNICSGQETKILKGPEDFNSYRWEGPAGGIEGPTNTRDITVNKAGTYNLYILPLTDYSVACPVKLPYIIKDNCKISAKNDTLCESSPGSKTIKNLELNKFNSKITENGKWGNVVSWHTAKPANNSNKITAPASSAINGQKFYAAVTSPYRSDTIPLTIYTYKTPTVNFPSIAPVCKNTTPFQLPLATPAGGIYTGPHTSSNGIFNPENVGKFDIAYQYTNTNGCMTTYTNTIFVESPLKVDAGTDTTMCETNSIIKLNARTDDTTQILWSGPFDSFSAPTQPKAIYKLSPEEKKRGFVVLKIATTNNKSCPPAFDSVKISFEKMPLVKVEKISPVCDDVSSVAIKATLNNFKTFQWRKSLKRNLEGTSSGLNYIIDKEDKTKGSVNIILTAAGSRYCPAASDSTILIIHPHPVVALDNDSLCPGDTALLSPNIVNISSIPEDKLTYVWIKNSIRTNAITRNFSATTSGIYIVQVTYNNCKGVDTAKVLQFPAPVLKVGNYEYCNEDSTMNIISFSEGIKYKWYLEENHKEVRNLSIAGRYLVIGTNQYGCITKTNSEISIACPPRLYISNAFSPNSDTKNDFYNIHEANVGKLQMLIFNRWGEIIFESQDKHHFWDGTYRGEFMPIGVYPWVINYEGNCEKFKGPYKKEGSVTIVK